jgi:hypothetical protein
MPMWQSEKSKLTGSSGFNARSDAVMSAAIRHRLLPRQAKAASDPNDVRIQRHNQRTTAHSSTRRDRPTWRTIHRRNRLSRLHALPADDEKVIHAGASWLSSVGLAKIQRERAVRKAIQRGPMSSSSSFKP